MELNLKEFHEYVMQQLQDISPVDLTRAERNIFVAALELKLEREPKYKIVGRKLVKI